MAQPTPHDTPAGKVLAEHQALHALLGEIERASADTRAAADEVDVRHEGFETLLDLERVDVFATP